MMKRSPHAESGRPAIRASAGPAMTMVFALCAPVHPGRKFHRYVFFRSNSQAELVELEPTESGRFEHPVPIPPP